MCVCVCERLRVCVSVFVFLCGCCWHLICLAPNYPQYRACNSELVFIGMFIHHRLPIFGIMGNDPSWSLMVKAYHSSTSVPEMMASFRSKNGRVPSTSSDFESSLNGYGTSAKREWNLFLISCVRPRHPKVTLTPNISQWLWTLALGQCCSSRCGTWPVRYSKVLAAQQQRVRGWWSNLVGWTSPQGRGEISQPLGALSKTKKTEKELPITNSVQSSSWHPADPKVNLT